MEQHREPRADVEKPIRPDFRIVVEVTEKISGHITAQQHRDIRRQLTARIFRDAREPIIEPVFDHNPEYANGVMKLWCSNDFALDWLERSVADITLETGAELVVRRLSDLPRVVTWYNESVRMVSCGILLDDVHEDLTFIRQILAFQNPWAQLDRWVLHTTEIRAGASLVFVSIPEDMVEVLVGRRRKLAFALGSVRLEFQVPMG